jgi:pyruvate ferredoxin oxidoreductase beta subunit
MSKYRSIRDIPREEYVSPGSSLCPGCGADILVRHVLKVLGKHTIMVNVPGCYAISTLFPYTSVKIPFVFAVFASGAAVAQGIKDALDILYEKRSLDRDKVDYNILVYIGDGAAYDIGFQAISSAIHRQLDFYLVCYDNEAYGNTGFQLSSASPFASYTSTSPAVGSSIGNIYPKKDIFEIWRAHKVPYVATISISHVMDLLNKLEYSKQFKGPKLFIALSICPTGWGGKFEDTVKLARLAVETGMWPLKEAVYGKVKHTFIPRRLKPVEEYLKLQGRFRHLFKPIKREDLINQIQEDVNKYWERVKEEE